MSGSLIYMIGPSGVGKDTLIEIAKVRFAGFGGIKFARRFITRPLGAGGEDFTSISRPAFDYLDAKGAFLFSWLSHGLAYGVDRQAERYLQDGFMVIVNGSRAYLPKAMELYPSLKPLLITAGNEALATRLKKRGRESIEEQAERLHQPDYDYKWIKNLHTIDNSGELSHAADRFCSFLNEEWTKIASRRDDLRHEPRPAENIMVNDEFYPARVDGGRLFSISGFIDKIRGKGKCGKLEISG